MRGCEMKAIIEMFLIFPPYTPLLLVQEEMAAAVHADNHPGVRTVLARLYASCATTLVRYRGWNTFV